MKNFKPDPKKIPIRLSGKAKREFRKHIFKKYKGICEGCGVYAPLKGDTVFEIGHVAHIKSSGSGGSDTEDNVRWLCYNCHINKEHGPIWSNK